MNFGSVERRRSHGKVKSGAHPGSSSSDQAMEIPQSAAEELCSRALTLPGAQRIAFLDSACKGNGELRRRVESLLVERDGFSQSKAETYHASGDSPTVAMPALSAGIGKNSARYLILNSLGAGGMGVVYRARARSSSAMWQSRS